jgi:hypothetical protein
MHDRRCAFEFRVVKIGVTRSQSLVFRDILVGQCAEQCIDGELIESHQFLRATLHGRSFSGTGQADSGASNARTRMTPRRSMVVTVPKGKPVLLEISACDIPWASDKAITCCCGSGR